MREINQIASHVFRRIEAAKTEWQTIQQKSRLIEQIQNHPKRAAYMYFEIFARMVNSYGGDADDWEKMALLVHFNIDPLSVRNKQGQNPFEFFYQKNRKMRRSFHSPKALSASASDQDDRRLLYLSNWIYHIFLEKGVPKEQLLPLKKNQVLWQNYASFLRKSADTERVAFARLVKTVAVHSADAPSVFEMRKVITHQIRQEQQDEKEAIKRRRKLEKIYPLFQCGSTRREHSKWYKGFYALFDAYKNYLLYQPLPKTSRQAMADYLCSLKDVDKICNLKEEDILTPKRIRVYERAIRLGAQRIRSR